MIKKSGKVDFDVAIPGDFVIETRRLKIYRNTKILHMKYLKCKRQKTVVIAIVIGALGAESLLTEYLALIGLMTRKDDGMQQTAMLESSHILRKVLSISA